MYTSDNLYLKFIVYSHFPSAIQIYKNPENLVKNNMHPKLDNDAI